MEQEYLTIKETAELLRIKPHTVRERMQRGVFKIRIHYFRRRGMRPLFKRAALIEWVEEGQKESHASIEPDGSPAIPMSRGYYLEGAKIESPYPEKRKRRWKKR